MENWKKSGNYDLFSSGLAGSIASVFSKHIITACRTFRSVVVEVDENGLDVVEYHFCSIDVDLSRETKFVISMPIPRNTEGGQEGDCLQLFDSLRR